MIRIFRHLAATALLSVAGAAPAPMTVTLTAYTASAAETDSTPELSACGRTRANQIALSRDLFRVKYHCGDQVRVYRPDTGRWHTYVVWDTMNARYTRRADILMSSRTAALNFGRRTGQLQ